MIFKQVGLDIIPTSGIVVATTRPPGTIYYETCLYYGDETSEVVTTYNTISAAEHGHASWVAKLTGDSECH